MGRIILIPSMPEDMPLDLIFQADMGIAVQVSEEEIQALRARNVAIVELYTSGNEYAEEMTDLSEEQAFAVIEARKNTALAALTPTERSQFGVA